MNDQSISGAPSGAVREPKATGAEEIYASVCAYLAANGWHREEPGSGWWIHESGEEARVGEALDAQLYNDGIDTRQEPGYLGSGSPAGGTT